MSTIPTTPPTNPPLIDVKLLPWYSGKNGATNFTRWEIQRRARLILESEDYQQSLAERIRDKSLAPGIEAMLWYYAYGKPIENVNIKVSQEEEDLSKLSTQELMERAKKLHEQLEEAAQVEQALPAQYRVA